MQKYEILEQIGQGTYGVVFKCRDKQNGQLVAVKEFKKPTNPTDPQYLKITSREVQTLKLAKHPFVVDILDAFRRKQKTFLVFEHCESTVLQLIEHHLLDPYTVKLISLQILYALRHLHEINMVHRDIKPENLLLQFRNSSEMGLQPGRILPLVKLCDFGFARRAGPSSILTQYVSTRWYRAPELLVGDDYSFPVDIWAFGLVLSEMITGDPLMPGDTDLDMLHRIQTGIGALTPQQAGRFAQQPKNQGRRLPAYRHDMVAERLRGAEDCLDQLLRGCLAIDPNQRISAAEAINATFYDDVRADVERILQALQGRDGSADSIEKLCAMADQQIARSKSQLSIAQARMKTPAQRSFSNIRQQNCVIGGVLATQPRRPDFRDFQRPEKAESPYLPRPAFKTPQARVHLEAFTLCQPSLTGVSRVRAVNLPGLRRK